MRKTTMICATLAVSFGAPAHANFARWCLDAQEAGNAERAARMADMTRRSSVEPGDAATALECLRQVTQTEYRYHRPTKRVLPAADYDAILERERLAEEAERERLAAEEAERQRLLEQRAQLEAGIAMARRARQDSVQEQLAQSCTRLFRTDPDRTITNKLCYDYFYAAGLPD